MGYEPPGYLGYAGSYGYSFGYLGHYKSARKVLIEKPEGNSAFRSGKKPEKVVAE
jgi:hypothetical protein